MILILCVLLLACENPETVYYFHEPIEETYECCEGEHCATLSMNYPRFKPINPTLMQVNVMVREKILSYLQVGEPDLPMEQGAIENFCEVYKDMVGSGGESTDWELDTQVAITQQGVETLSLRFTHHYFTGGAHSNSVMDYLIFDLREPGKIIKPEELILNKQALLRKVENAFREIHEVEDGLSLAEDGRFFLEKDSLFLPAAMGYEEGEWVMVYNTYEVGPYAMGQTVLNFPMEDLRGIVKGWK
jgi:hypothetical protein